MPAEAASAASINWNDRARHWAKAAPAGAPTASAMQINRNLIACARLKPGDHVLDLASGTGEPAISMALAVVRTLARTATFIPMKPAMADEDAPRR